MANIEKYKDQARKFELKEQWSKAVEPLLKAIETMERSPEDDTDLSLYNRVGDLYQKIGDTSRAVTYYERAAERYGEAGFHNNAIALCNKVVRLSPGRSSIYLKLGMFFAAKGFTAEARENLLEYADRMQKAGQLEEAFKALRAFAEMTPGQDDVWAVLAQQARASARTPDQREQVEKLLAEFEQKDRVVQRKSRLSRHMITGEELPREPVRKPGELVFLDLGEEPARRRSSAPPAPVPQAPPPRKSAVRPAAAVEPPPLEIERTFFAPAEEAPAPTPALEIEPTSLVEPAAAAADLGLEPTALAAEPPAPPAAEPELLELEVSEGAAPPAAEPSAAEAVSGLPLLEIEEEVPAAPAPGLPLLEIEEEAPTAPAAGAPQMEVEEAAPAAGVPLVEMAEAPAAGPPPAEIAPPPAEAAAPMLDFVDLGEVTEVVPTVADLEAKLAAKADDWATRRRLGEVLLDEGQRERGIRELDASLDGSEQAGELNDAYAVTEEILRLDPNSIRHQQKRVELAYRQGDRSRLVDAYIELGDALLRSNEPSKAVAVYQRVLEHDAANARARAALETLVPPAAPAAAPALAPPAAPAAAGSFVDLGAMLLEEERGPKDTRMRVEDEEPTGDEEADFQSMLQAFKRGIAANVGEEDFESHYDLGVAYKEMGLLDEAIAEFQKALRATEGRLKSSEALGMCFFEKGQFAVCETILRRGLEAPAVSDAERIGLLYWLGRALEEQGRGTDALGAYNRVFGVDINFQDVSRRVQAIHARAGA
jgi:tetratricopeptide (TPR) repeat protein